MANPNLTVCGRPSTQDYSQYPFISREYLPSRSGSKIQPLTPIPFQGLMFGDANYGLISNDQVACSDYNSPPYPPVPNGSNITNGLGLAPGWYYGTSSQCAQLTPPMSCEFNSAPPEGCTYPFYPEGCLFTQVTEGGSEQPLMCSSDWSGVMKPENLKLCCSGQATTSGVCHPEWCPASGTCSSLMQEVCPPETFDQSCVQYANIAPAENAGPVVLNAVRQFYSYSNPTADDPFVGMTAQLCSKFPGLCDSVLQSACSTFTVEDLNPSNWAGRTNDPDGTNLMKVCGCFLPSSQYVFANGLSGPSGIACNSVCSFPGTVPVYDPSQAKAAQCTATVCALNDVVVDVSSSSLNAVGLTQVCGQCNSSDPCICYFNNVQVNDITDPTLQFQIASNCQTCFNYDPTTGTSTQVTCPGGGASGGFISNVNTFVSSNKSVVTIVSIVLLVLILAVIFWISAKPARK